MQHQEPFEASDAEARLMPTCGKCLPRLAIMWQIPRTSFAAGDRVTVRGDRWQVERVEAYPGCELLHLTGIGSVNRGSGCALLLPFDRPTPLDRPARLCVTTRAGWMRAFRTLALDATPCDRLRAAAPARLEILAYQLEPALAAIRGVSSRILIADEVGLGKTIQAGLLLAELRSRGWANRTLILTPAGLRDQWAAELEHRFGIHAAAMESSAVRARASQLPAGVNPWEIEEVSIASIDSVKRPETAQALAAIVWDLLIVDEAHLVATAPQRAAAVHALAERARRIVLLTATPHAGDERAFVSLCGIGRLPPEDGILLFRRTRRDAGMTVTRRVHLLAVRLSREERRMHRLLDAYTARVWREGRSLPAPAARLVAVVLTKRGLSSASSLARSVQRRLDLLPRDGIGPAQADLPLGPPEGDLDEADAEPALGLPALSDPNRERGFLRAILQAARDASGAEAKLAALARLLRRVREPAVVFTEYRDTLEVAAERLGGLRTAVCLHGGLDEMERRSALDAFNTGRSDLLLATDAGGEGLNLHARCRLVINLELPWNPVRLEQRIGRVDRLGQRRTVHAFNLFARGTAEAAVLARLVARLERARRTLGPLNDPVCSVAESEIADAAFSHRSLDRLPAGRSSLCAFGADTVRSVDFRREASAEACRIAQLRPCSRRSAQDERPARIRGGPLPGSVDVPVASIPQRRLGVSGHLGEQPSVVWLFRAQAADTGGHGLEDILVPVRLPIGTGHAVNSRAQLRGLVVQLLSRLRQPLAERAEAAAKLGAESRARLREPALLLARSRERAIGGLQASTAAVPVQAGLFDSRAIAASNEARRLQEAIRAQVDSRLSLLQSAFQVTLARPVELAMVLVVHDGRL
jgi:superfamily II DNA or RNA helicase